MSSDELSSGGEVSVDTNHLAYFPFFKKRIILSVLFSHCIKASFCREFQALKIREDHKCLTFCAVGIVLIVSIVWFCF